MQQSSAHTAVNATFERAIILINRLSLPGIKPCRAIGKNTASSQDVLIVYLLKYKTNLMEEWVVLVLFVSSLESWGPLCYEIIRKQTNASILITAFPGFSAKKLCLLCLHITHMQA